MILKYLREFFRFLKHIKNSRKLLFILAYDDFRQQYLGSYLGIVWAVLRPLLFILILWFVFSMGLRGGTASDGTPFILYLLCGVIPWFFFVESLSKGMSAIVTNKYLVKKVAFRVSILPIVKILSALGIHLILVTILIVVFFLHGYLPTLYWLQLPFYILSTMILVLGLGWLTSSIRVFVKDMSEVIGVVVQFGFWLTPIFWKLEMVPDKYHYIIKLNPMVYVVEGFRGTFIYKEWFWDRGFDTVLFFLTIVLFLIFGATVFRRLRPHFGDVL